ncbi:MAG TPA: Rieske 2Fe-2S domain-containing protein [Phycisphaerae bacterium]|jgi:3-phenylpropionate/trans-cinnamate dioxygenase ferredoxin subunit
MDVAWIAACKVDEIKLGSVKQWNHQGQVIAIYRTAEDQFYATDGLCTHFQVPLAGGVVIGNLIECPKHAGRFDVTTGKPRGGPVCVSLKTFPVKVEHGEVFVQVADNPT